MVETLEAKFTQKDIDEATQWTYRARTLLENIVKSNKYDKDLENWTVTIIEKLRPYLSGGNVVEMHVRALQRLYKEKTGKEYQTPEDYHS